MPEQPLISLTYLYTPLSPWPWTSIASCHSGIPSLLSVWLWLGVLVTYFLQGFALTNSNSRLRTSSWVQVLEAGQGILDGIKVNVHVER